MTDGARRWLLLILGAAALVVAVAGTLAWTQYRSFLARPIIDEGEPRSLLVEPGTSFAGMVGQLEAGGLVEEAFWWRVLGWRLDAGARIKAGEFRVEPGMTPRQFLADVMAGRVVQHAFTIVEGWTFADLRRALAGETRLVHATEGLDAPQVMARIGHPDLHPEGRFLPETYHYTRGTADVELLRRAFASMERELAGTWETRDTGLPYESPDEVLVMASIIEKETGVPEERRRIAGVFLRRLDRGMRLQTDPTVIYGLGESFDGNLRRDDLRRDTPYNTYTRGGLPPTPIALPGRASLSAAVHPAEGSALYFVSRGDGSHVFSDTLAEHNRAVARYQLQRKDGS